MEFIRLVSSRHFDQQRQRFQSWAFKNSSEDRGGGISLIDKECIAGTGLSTCEHIRRYYQPTIGDVVIFWEIPSNLPAGGRLEQETTDSGDDCHYNLRDLSDNQAKQYFKSKTPSLEGFRICDDDHHRELTLEDITRQK